MGHRYSHLELAERRQIATLMEAKVPIADIACQLGRHRSTIYRETRRNFYHTDFRDRWGQEYRGAIRRCGEYADTRNTAAIMRCLGIAWRNVAALVRRSWFTAPPYASMSWRGCAMAGRHNRSPGG